MKGTLQGHLHDGCGGGGCSGDFRRRFGLSLRAEQSVFVGRFLRIVAIVAPFLDNFPRFREEFGIDGDGGHDRHGVVVIGQPRPAGVALPHVQYPGHFVPP